MKYFADKKTRKEHKEFIRKVDGEVRLLKCSWGERKVIKKAITKYAFEHMEKEGKTFSEFADINTPLDMVRKYYTTEVFDIVKRKARIYDFYRKISIFLSVIVVLGVSAVILNNVRVISLKSRINIDDDDPYLESNVINYQNSAD